jgi:hypothetical protein
MDDYTIKEKDKEVAGITVTYDDGSTKEIQQGCCVDLKNGSDDLSVELLNIKDKSVRFSKTYIWSDGCDRKNRA